MILPEERNEPSVREPLSPAHPVKYPVDDRRSGSVPSASPNISVFKEAVSRKVAISPTSLPLNRDGFNVRPGRLRPRVSHAATFSSEETSSASAVYPHLGEVGDHSRIQTFS